MADLFFRGQSARGFGLYVDAVGAPIRAASRREAVELAGRSGYVIGADDSDAPISYPVTFFLPSRQVDSLPRIYGWLSGSVGELCLPTDTDHVLHAVVLDEISPTLAAGGYEIQVVFVCQPYRYQMPAGLTFMATNGGTVVNPGTAPALPKIEVTADGPGALEIGGTEIMFDASGVITLDSEAEEASDADVYLSVDQFPAFPPGPSPVSWSGGVVSVKVTPRWCDR